jgi:hypothetical protein
LPPSLGNSRTIVQARRPAGKTIRPGMKSTVSPTLNL